MAGFCSQAESRRDDRDGDIKRLNLPPLDRQQLRDMIYSIMTDSQVKNFEEHWEADFSTEVKGIARFRVNVFNQNRGLAVVFRTIPSRVLSLEDLKAPEKFVDIIDVPRGLVLVTGPTGSGKPTTLAAMLNHINENKHEHILTIEDPIEFVHKPKKSVVIQREVGIDTASYGTALKNSLRQAPDVILIGEIRDVDTMQYAMHFAETGHLCLATLHATNSVQALERIYNFFPREQRHQIQPELAENLHCLITQRLLPRSDRPGRIVAMEMMMNTPYISHLISEGDLGAIPEAMERGNPAEGVFTFDHSIF
ncbi:PilT/PilU family type 4a pilus ATPase, partial [Cardiobacterium hominis]|uniref:PilT/PilU family type 4a pilus ATPase n=1 Tax=Cardiobacterium hominis TaxID=2718 RepID=UPI0028F053E7